jgi:hypothetical protein
MIRRRLLFAVILIAGLSVISFAAVRLMRSSGAEKQAGKSSLGLATPTPTPNIYATPAQIAEARKRAIAAGLTDAQMKAYLDYVEIVAGVPIQGSDRRFLEEDMWLEYIDRPQEAPKIMSSYEKWMKGYRALETPYDRAYAHTLAASEYYCANKLSANPRHRELNPIVFRHDPVMVEDCAVSRRMVRESALAAVIAVYDFAAKLDGRPPSDAVYQRYLRKVLLSSFKELPDVYKKNRLAFAERLWVALQEVWPHETPQDRAQALAEIHKQKSGDELLIYAYGNLAVGADMRLDVRRSANGALKVMLKSLEGELLLDSLRRVH